MCCKIIQPQPKVIQPKPKYKTRNFPNLRKRLLRDINWNQKQTGISKCYLVRVQVPQTQLNSLFVFFPVQQWPCHNDIMADKDSNLCDECAAECVHLCPLEEECTFSFWRDSKMYTPHRQDAN